MSKQQASSGLFEQMIWSVDGQQVTVTNDVVAVEEPLEIKLTHGPIDNRQQYSLAITMRTPGQDVDLVTGFLFTEGIIGGLQDLHSIQHTGQALDISAADNIISAALSPLLFLDTNKFSRHFYTSSSCGVCGKASIDMVQSTSCHFPRPGLPAISLETLQQLVDRLLRAQTLFEHTGGIHAAALFDTEGELLLVREDVGRHNALDKLMGAALTKSIFPLREHIILVSGRLSFELVQKAAMAGVPVLVAIGAPSSLAIQLAKEHGMTLIGFLRKGRCNIYTGRDRILLQG